MLINTRESTVLKHFNNPKASIECSNYMDDIFKKYDEKILIIFDDMITGLLSNKKHNPIVIEMFIRGRKLKFCCFYFLPKNIRLN